MSSSKLSPRSRATNAAAKCEAMTTTSIRP
jgi:hypothetical protein